MVRGLISILILSVSLYATNVGRVILHDGTEIVKVSSDSSLQVTTVDSPFVKVADTVIVKIQPSDTIKIWDGSNLFKTDGTTNAIQTILYPHYKIHSGRHYFVESYDNMANAADSIDFCVFARDTSRWAHMFFMVSTEKAALFCAYEDATFDTTTGTTVTAYNNNRNSANTSILLIKRDATVSADGTELFCTTIGFGDNPANSIGGESGRENELILKQNTYYRFHFETITNDNDIDWLAEWYEHINN